MTTSSSILNKMVADGNGYLQTEAVVKQGISKTALAAYVRAHQMERVAHGLYLSPDAWPDEFFQVSVVNKRAILSHETALYLHDLTERESLAISVTLLVITHLTSAKRACVFTKCGRIFIY